ncbi:hypothetical protein C3K47_15590 [Solitalea longa]|uniref:AbiTii domain-containing protein n=1 Tax=Solitalea longa TaxID=2079460 RepID=A0A2S4ZYP8_9SPHI|nr:hypothetical protein [Solitalea longa]POY35481.1 hypothetical protein C3K47_15590 [Solitalea longa]
MHKELLLDLTKGRILVSDALEVIMDIDDVVNDIDFHNWVKLEIDGYEKIDRALIPDYRWVEADIILVGPNNSNDEIHTVLEIPEEHYFQLGYMPIKHSIATIENELLYNNDEYKKYPLTEFEVQGFSIASYGWFYKKGIEIQSGYRRCLIKNLEVVRNGVKDRLIQQLTIK